jgi:hypothetical protein
MDSDGVKPLCVFLVSVPSSQPNMQLVQSTPEPSHTRKSPVETFQTRRDPSNSVGLPPPASEWAESSSTIEQAGVPWCSAL